MKLSKEMSINLAEWTSREPGFASFVFTLRSSAETQRAMYGLDASPWPINSFKLV